MIRWNRWKSATVQRGDDMANKEEKKAILKKEAAYEKESFLKSKIYRTHHDLLDAVLEDSRKYTVKEVNEILKKELNRKVVC